MNENLWRKFWMETFTPVFFEGKEYVDLEIVSTNDYPALAKLQERTTVEVLLLAMLISNAKVFADWQSEPMRESDIYETFASYDCTEAEVINSLLKLHKIGWVEVLVDTDTGETFHKALLLPLFQAGIYIPDNAASRELVASVAQN